MKTSYKVKRLRDGAALNLDAAHALNLFRLNAKQKISEFELDEKNYLFGNNEIYKRPNTNTPKISKV